MTPIPHQGQLQEKFLGVIMGTAVGDALGLPAEGLSPRKIRRRWKGAWKMRFFGRLGMVSDDTEHLLLVAECLLQHPKSVEDFQTALGHSLRRWFMSLPAGIGMATAKACLRLLVGMSPQKSGVNSAGNGPLMRSAIIGAFFAEGAVLRASFTQASTRITHRNNLAEASALALAEAAAWGWAGNQPSLFAHELRNFSFEEVWSQMCSAIQDAIRDNLSVEDFAKSLNLENGVSGYVMHTLPISLYSWMRLHHDFKTALISALNCGGDTDSVGAIVGGLCGATHGINSIPEEWRCKIGEWPRTRKWMEGLSFQLAEATVHQRPILPLPYFWPGIILRNIFFLFVVLAHGLRRCFPPY